MAAPVTAPLPLRSSYSGQTLLLCGLSGDGTRELYKFVDLAAREVREVSVDIADFRRRQLQVLERELGGHRVPYGLDTLTQLLPYFLHPHSFLQTSAGDVVVSFKQAPYLRVLPRDGAEWATWPAPDEVEFDRMLSSTTGEMEPGTVCVSATDSAARFRRYRGGSDPVPGSVLRYEVATGLAKELQPMPDFVIDTLHEMVWSPAGYFVGVDMNLSAEEPPGGWAAAGLDGEHFDVERYAAQPFPPSQFFVADADADRGPAGRRSSVHTPSAASAAHVDIDLRDPSVFYVSCHNISKWRSNVVLHGPGAVDRYRYQDGQVTLLGSYSAPDFLRVTSQKLFERDGRQLAAVTSFPNAMVVLDVETMTPVQRVTLFEEPERATPYAVEKNSTAPLFLTVCSQGRYVYLTGASHLFVVDLDRGETVDQVQFCAPGSFAATAHIDVVDPVPAAAR